MIRLRTLGALDVRTQDDRVLARVLAQPKRLALLVYLCTADRAAVHRRDRLLALFWPELDATHARDALNSAILFLRREVGKHVIVTRGGEEIGVDGALCWCDAGVMRASMAAGRYDEALALYHGDFLAAFHLDGSPAFDEWLECERVSLRAEAFRAARTLSHRAARDGDTAAAVSFSRRAFELAPDDERALRELLQVLDQAGDRVGAIQTYASYARRIAAEYDAMPAPETQAVIDRIRLRTSAHASPHSVEEHSAPTGATGDGSPSEPAATTRRRSTRRRIAAGGIVAASTVVAVGAWLRASPRPSMDANTIVVVPFRVTGSDSSVNYLRDGIIDLANVELSGDGVPRPVDSRTVLARVRSELPEGRTSIDPETAVRVARALGAGQVLLGEIVAANGNVAATARAVRVRDGRVLAQHAERGTNELEVARRLLRRVLALAGGESRDRLQTVSDSADAVRAYIAGLAAFREARYEASVSQFRRAVGIDSTFALGWLWLSTASQYTGNDHLYARLRAWSLRAALSPRDQAYLAAIHDVRPRTARQKVEAYALAAAENPDRPEVWRMWSIALGIEGAAAGIDGWRARAVAAADSAIALDSAFAPAIAFRLELALRADDRAYLARTGRALLAKLPDGPGRDLIRWAIAHALGDSAAVVSVRAAFPRLASSAEWAANEVTGASVVFGLPLDDAERIAMVGRATAARRDLVVRALVRLREIAAIRGRLGAVGAISDSIAALGAVSWNEPVSAIMLGLTEPPLGPAAARAALQLEAMADTTRSRALEAIALCHAQLWRIAQHDTATARPAIGRLRAAERALEPDENWWWVDNLGVCSLLLDAALEAEGGFRTRGAFARLEAAMRDGISRPPVALGLLMLSRWYEASGDNARALDALRRRIRVGNGYYYLLEPRFLREEGRLAAIVHDTSGATIALRHYLVLRDRPDSGPMADEVRWVRAKLAELAR